MATDREERIRQLAHEIWEREGHPHGRDAEHWRQATEVYEAERAASRLDDTGEVIDSASRTSPEWTTLTPPVATPAVATPTGAAANQPVATRKRRTKAEIEAARAAEATVPKTRRGLEAQDEDAPKLVAETAPNSKRKRRTKTEIAAAGVAGAAAAVVAMVAATKRRRGAKAGKKDAAAPLPAADVALRRSRKSKSEATLSGADPVSVAVASDPATGAVPDLSADGPSNVASDLVPDPGVEAPSDAALETFPESAPDADVSGERVAD